jgi:hypothetical protein
MVTGEIRQIGNGSTTGSKEVANIEGFLGSVKFPYCTCSSFEFAETFCGELPWVGISDWVARSEITDDFGFHCLGARSILIRSKEPG